MNKKFTEKDYRKYLIGLIPSIFKMLYLYEERNEFLMEYIDSLLHFELFGASEAIGDLPKSIWYGKVISTLEGIEKKLDSDFSDPSIGDNHRRFRREILKMTNLIDKQIDGLEG